MPEYLSQFSPPAIIAFISGLIVFITLVEKLVQKEFVGRRFFRLLGRMFMFLFGWLTMPIQPQIKRIKDAAFIGERTNRQLNLLLKKGDERDEAIAEFKETLADITKEFKTNGGNSIKDDFVTLLKSDEHKIKLLHELRDCVQLNTLRINIIDDDDGRMIFHMSPELDVTKISASFLRFFGWTENDIVGGDWDLVLAERSRATVMAKWDKALKKRLEYSNLQYITDSDGKEHLCEVHGYPLFPNGEFIGFFGTVKIVHDEPPVTHIEGEVTIVEKTEK